MFEQKIRSYVVLSFASINQKYSECVFIWDKNGSSTLVVDEYWDYKYSVSV